MSQEVQESGETGLPSLTGPVKIILPNLVSQQFQQVQYNQKAALGLGITQIILGAPCIISNIVILATSKRNFPSIMAYGFWGGILFAVAGLLEVLSARKAPNMRLICGSMVMSVVAAFVGGIVLSLAILDACNQGAYVPNYDMSYESLVFGIIMIVSALAEILVSVAGSIVCCGTFCHEYSLNIPISVNMDGNQLVMGYLPTNSYYQALVNQPN